MSKKRNIRTIFSALLLVFLSNISYSQSDSEIRLMNQIDSIVLKNNKAGKFNTSVQVIKEGLVNNQWSIPSKTKLYCLLTSAFGMSNQIDSIESYVKKGIAPYDKGLSKKDRDYFLLLLNWQNAKILSSKFAEALNVNDIILKEFKKRSHSEYLSSMLTRATILSKLGTPKESNKYLEKVFTLLNDEDKSFESLNSFYKYYHILALNHYYINNRIVNNKIVEFSKKSLSYALKTQHFYLIMGAKNDLGTFLWKAGKYQESITLLHFVDSVYQVRNITSVNTLYSLLKAHYELRNEKEALHYMNRIEKSGKSLQDDSAIEFSAIKEALVNNNQVAYDLLQRLKLNKDSAYSELVDNRLLELEQEYKLSEKSNEILNLKRSQLEEERKKLILEKLNNEITIQNINNEILIQHEVVKKDSLMKALSFKAIEFEKIKLNEQLAIKEIAYQKIRKNAFLGFLVMALFTVGFFSYRSSILKNLNQELKSKSSQIQLLNRELNHRVKNNLAFMTSLLEMQGRRTGNTETRQLLRESETRLKTLALVHANLFKNELDTEINLRNYLTELISHLESIFSIPGKQIDMDIQLTDYILNAEDAMRLGLIVNELITNSIKHAFDEVENPVISIQTSVNDKGKLVLNYKDNGPGITKTPSSSSTGSLGTKLIALLKDQLGNRYVVAA
ncbi:MAG: sensor histidine kinase [Bacteroidia bacterium]|nr:sensor histidine kinase [Bacteroidia bacterium]